MDLNLIGTIIVGSIAIGVAIIVPKLILINQIFSQLLTEYRSTEMGIAVKHIWNFYKNDCGGDKDNDEYLDINKKQKIIVDEYNKIRDWEDKNLNTYEEWQNSILYYRRLVTHFYRNLAYLRFSWIIRLTKRKIKRIFSSWDMRILGILCPIEIRHIIDGDDGKIHKSTLYLFKLYKKSQQWISLDICLKQFKRRNRGYLIDN